MSAVVWTPELRGRIYPSRNHPNSGALRELLDEVGLSVPLEAAAARTRAAREWTRMHRSHLVVALEKSPAAWSRTLERLIGRNKDASDPAPPDVDVEAAMVALGMCAPNIAVPYWAATAGVPFALRALIRCYQIRGEGKIVEEPRTFDSGDDDTGEWRMLRALLAEAIEPAYDEAHGIADRARVVGTDAPSPLQLLLPFVFPDEPIWAKAAAPAALAYAKRQKRGFCYELARYLSVAPVDVGVQVLSSMWNNSLEPADLITALARQGPMAGVRLLEAAAAKSPHAEGREEIASILFAIRTPEAGKAFERLAKHPKGKGTFAPLAKQHRELILANAARKPRKLKKRKSARNT